MGSEGVLIATLGSEPQVVTLSLNLLRAVTGREACGERRVALGRAGTLRSDRSVGFALWDRKNRHLEKTEVHSFSLKDAVRQQFRRSEGGHLMGLDFVAVDFETANHDPSSACAIGLAFVRDGHLTESTSYLIRPPSHRFVFTCVHGLTWDDVRDAPSFSDLWDDLRDQIRSEILVAHNATFDKAVLSECLLYYGIRYRLNPFLCSMQLSKEAFGFSHLKLDYICKQLEIDLQHHEAESDAKAAANIVIKAASRLGSVDARSLFEFCRS